MMPAMSSSTAKFYDLRGQKVLDHPDDQGLLTIPLHLSAPYRFHEKQLPVKDGLFLDFGCGTGLHSFYPLTRGYRVFGLDISEKSVLAARTLAEKQGVTEKCHFQHGSLDALAESNESFDVIFMSGVLYYLDRSQALPLIVSKLVPGGRFICIETNAENRLMNLWRRFRQILRGDRDQQTLSHLLGPGELKGFSRYFPQTQIVYFDFLTLFGVALKKIPLVREIFHRLARSADYFLLNRLGLSSLSFKMYFVGTKSDENLDL